MSTGQAPVTQTFPSPLAIAEGVPFTHAEMAQLLALADKGIRELVAAQKTALGV